MSDNSYQPSTPLPETELRLVILLKRVTEARAAELAAALGEPYTRNTVQALLYRLEKRGLVVSVKRFSYRQWTLAPGVDVEALLRDDARRTLGKRYCADPWAVSVVVSEAEHFLPRKATRTA